MCCNWHFFFFCSFTISAKRKKLIWFIRLSYLLQCSKGCRTSFCLIFTLWKRKGVQGNQVNLLYGQAGSARERRAAGCGGTAVENKGLRKGHGWDGATINSRKGTTQAKEQQCVRGRMEQEKWPKSSLEIIMARWRQLNSASPWSVSAVQGGIWVGFTFWSLAT